MDTTRAVRDNESAPQSETAVPRATSSLLVAEWGRFKSILDLATAEAKLSTHSFALTVASAFIAAGIGLAAWCLLMAALALWLQAQGFSIVNALLSLALLHAVVSVAAIIATKKAAASIGLSRTRQALSKRRGRPSTGNE